MVCRLGGCRFRLPRTAPRRALAGGPFPWCGSAARAAVCGAPPGGPQAAFTAPAAGGEAGGVVRGGSRAGSGHAGARPGWMRARAGACTGRASSLRPRRGRGERARDEVLPGTDGVGRAGGSERTELARALGYRDSFKRGEGVPVGHQRSQQQRPRTTRDRSGQNSPIPWSGKRVGAAVWDAGQSRVHSLGPVRPADPQTGPEGVYSPLQKREEGPPGACRRARDVSF